MLFAFKLNHILVKLALNAPRLESPVLQPATGAVVASTLQLTDCSFSTTCYDSTAVALVHRRVSQESFEPYMIIAPGPNNVKLLDFVH